MTLGWRASIAAAVAIAVALPSATAQGAATLPAGFVDELVATAPAPTALAFLHNDHMLVASKGGQLDVYKPNGTLVVRALDFSSRMCADGERGLLGVAVDPSFASNRFVYIYGTFKLADCDASGLQTPVNRIVRVKLADDFRMVEGSEVVLVDGMVNAGSVHTGGDLSFGKDGHLYATTGDGGCHYATGACGGANTAARERHTLLGKVIRITRSGGIPASNPFPGGARCNRAPTTPDRTCAEIYALGLRNPFRFAFDPNAAGTRFYVNDVGAARWEEVNLGKSGADYGWNVREGHCRTGSYNDCPPPPAGMTDPIYDYRHSTGCTSIVGGAFVPSGLWPPPYSGSYLYVDFVCAKIFRLVPVGGLLFSAVEFGQLDPRPVHVTFGPTGDGSRALYYTRFGPGNGVIRRIRFLGGTNRPPTAKLTASPTSGALPLEVSFDASDSVDPDGDRVTYRFDFGDGAPAIETSSATVTHTYASEGSYNASLVVVDAKGAASQPAQVTIHAGNTAPEVRITAPAEDYLFKVGDRITLRGEASDAEDGAVPGEALTWEVERVHDDERLQADTHSHPFLQPTRGPEATITAPPPENIYSTRNSFLKVELTATDSRGLSTTIVRDVRPKVVHLGIDSSPKGVDMTANGEDFRTPKKFGSWPGYGVRLIAPTTINNNGFRFFCHWNDGVRASDRIFTTPDGPRNLWAVYKTVC